MKDAIIKEIRKTDEKGDRSDSDDASKKKKGQHGLKEASALKSNITRSQG